MCAGRLLAYFYPDLANPAFTTPFALFHQRYATNVAPSWDRAQPLRMLAHNGEINTVWGNRARMDARAATFPDDFYPVFTKDGSDSTSLDETVELLARNGRTVAEAVRMLIPPAGNLDRSAFFAYASDCAEPWDGPAAVAFTDGDLIGAVLDRNGLRPCRYFVTEDDLVVLGSEAGLVDLDPEAIVHSGRLGPGQMIVADLADHVLLEDEQIQAIFDGAAKFASAIGVPLIGILLIKVGWRWSFAVTGFISLFYFFLFWRIYRDPQDDPELTIVERDYIATDDRIFAPNETGHASQVGQAPS